VKALVHFQAASGGCNFWVDSTSQSLAGYRDMVKSPHFVPRFVPSVHIDAPAANSSVGGVIPVQVSAQDADGVSSVTLAVDGKPLATDTAAPYFFSWNTQTLPPGPHELTATALDTTGSRGVDRIQVTVRDTMLPTVKFAAPADCTRITSTTFNIDVKASNNVGGHLPHPAHQRHLLPHLPARHLPAHGARLDAARRPEQAQGARP
jgi:hypothetical protein